MSLLSLPPEILRMVASELPDHQDVLDLICTNRFLHDLLIRDLYKKNIDTDPTGFALFWCVMTGARKGMRHLLSWEVDVNRELWWYDEEKSGIITWDPTSALRLAVEDDNLPMADLLLEHGADANAIFPERMPTSAFWMTRRTITPLDVAVRRGNESMTILLLQNGAEIRDEITLRRAIDRGGLLAAAKAGRLRPWDHDFFKLSEVAPNYDFRAVVEVLHLYGANFNEVSLLHDAVEHYGSLDDGVIECLLNLSADVNAKDSEGGSVLRRAFENEDGDFQRCKAFTQLLTTYGAKVKLGELVNPLRDAMLRERFDWFELIIDYGADVNSLLYTDGNSLHLVIANEFHHHHTTQEKFLKSLLNRGADVLLRNHESKTPLEHAILFPFNTNLAKLLLDAGAKVQCQGKEGARLLNYLIQNEENAWYDLDTYDVQVDFDESGELHLYELPGIDAMIQLLIEYGVCPDYVDDSGQCPLDHPNVILSSSLQPWLSKRGEA